MPYRKVTSQAGGLYHVYNQLTSTNRQYRREPPLRLGGLPRNATCPFSASLIYYLTARSPCPMAEAAQNLASMAWPGTTGSTGATTQFSTPS